MLTLKLLPSSLPKLSIQGERGRHFVVCPDKYAKIKYAIKAEILSWGSAKQCGFDCMWPCDHNEPELLGKEARRDKAVANDSYRSQSVREISVGNEGIKLKLRLVAIKLTRSNMFVRVCECVCECVIYVHVSVCAECECVCCVHCANFSNLNRQFQSIATAYRSRHEFYFLLPQERGRREMGESAVVCERDIRYFQYIKSCVNTVASSHYNTPDEDNSVAVGARAKP